MLKNISDYISFITLFFLAIYGFYIFLLASVDREIDNSARDRRKLLNDYLNNEEE